MKIILLSVLSISFLTNSGNAQAVAGNKDLSADSAAIKKTAQDYVEGYFNGDAKRIGEAVDPELAKRIVYKDSNKQVQIH